MIHRPKSIRSNVPYGSVHDVLITTKVSDSCIITSEFWNDSPKPLWKIGDVVTARKGYTWKTTWELGKQFVVTRVYDASGGFVGSCWNISSEVRMLGEDFVYEDWYLDVWLSGLGKPVLLDASQLDEALEKGYISFADADTARWTAFRILELYNSS